jgi:hypothetical protein
MATPPDPVAGVKLVAGPAVRGLGKLLRDRRGRQCLQHWLTEAVLRQQESRDKPNVERRAQAERIARQALKRADSALAGSEPAWKSPVRAIQSMFNAGPATRLDRLSLDRAQYYLAKWIGDVFILEHRKPPIEAQPEAKRIAEEFFHLVAKGQNDLPSGRVDCLDVAQEMFVRFRANDQRNTGRQAVEVVGVAGSVVSLGALGFARYYPEVAPDQLVPGAVGTSALLVAATAVLALRSRPSKAEVEIADVDLLSELVVLTRTVCEWVFNVTHALWIELEFGDRAGPALHGLAKVTEVASRAKSSLPQPKSSTAGSRDPLPDLMTDMEQRVLPRVKQFHPPLLHAALTRCVDLLVDRAAGRPSYDPEELAVALTEVLGLAQPSVEVPLERELENDSNSGQPSRTDI